MWAAFSKHWCATTPRTTIRLLIAPDVERECVTTVKANSYHEMQHTSLQFFLTTSVFLRDGNGRQLCAIFAAISIRRSRFKREHGWSAKDAQDTPARVATLMARDDIIMP